MARCATCGAASIGAPVAKCQPAGRRLWHRSSGLLLALLLLAACAPEPLRTPPLTPAAVVPAAASAENPAALVEAERNAAATRDLSTLAALWAEDAQIVEWRGADADDAYRWQGREAILDRYRVAVFPAPPPPLDAPLGLAADVEGDAASLVNGVDTWQFAQRDGRWWITSLTIAAP